MLFVKNYRIKFIFLSLFLVILNLAGQEENAYLKIDTCWINKIERVYLHLPQQTIVAGEKLPFKAYILNANNLSAKSSIVYFDIINHLGEVMTSWKSDVINNTAFGKAIIPDSISSGIYILRSYTNWMLNSGTDFIFQTPLFIHNLRMGNTVDINKTIINSCEISPISAHKNKSGINICSTQEKGELALKITNESIYETTLLYLIFQGKTVMEKICFGHLTSTSLSLPSAANGIIYAIITNKKNIILAEKVIPLIRQEKSKLIINSLKENYNTGEDIVIQLSSNEFEETELSTFSCSISRQYNFSFSSFYPNINDYFFTYSEMPFNYWGNWNLDRNNLPFDSNQIKWNRSVWNHPNKKEFENCIYIKEIGAALLSGHIMLKKTSQPIASVSVSLSINDTTPQIIFFQTTEKGNFYFWIDKKFNNKELLLQIINDTISPEQVEWNIDENFPKDNNYTKESINLSVTDKNALNEIKQLTLINSFYNQTKENTKSNTDNYTTGSFIQYSPDYVRFPSEYSGLTSFLDIAENILPLVNIKNKNNKWAIEIYNPDERITLTSPLILLNGVPFSDLDILVKLPANEISKIEVYHSKIYFGDYTFQGIILIQTEQGVLPPNYITKHINVLLNKVLPPNDDIIYNDTRKNRNQPNLHSMLYWNPHIMIDKNTTFQINIKAPDLKGEYKINIEGISNKGVPISISKPFSIN